MRLWFPFVSFFSFSPVRNRSPWKMPLCAATGRIQTRRSAAKAEQPRSIVLDRLVFDLARLEIRIDDCAARNRNVLASQAVQTVLVQVIPTDTTWPSTNPGGDKSTHPHDGKGQSNMG